MKKAIAALTILLISCGAQKQTAITADDTMIAVSTTECPTTNINGAWHLLYTTKDNKATLAPAPATLIITDCTRSTTRTHSHTRTETFALYRMKRYCADYQLIYPNDSIACITLHGDTLSMGECNNFGETRWYYGKNKY